MRRIAFLVLVGLGVSGCSLLFPEDPRLGEETPEACIARFGDPAVDHNGNQFAGLDGAVVVPTFTYDVTNVSAEDLGILFEPGARGSTVSPDTPAVVAEHMERFMGEPVDEKGAFFLQGDPALYRVRGEVMAVGQAIRAGCERQMAGMRLISVDQTLAFESVSTGCPAVTPRGESHQDSVLASECIRQDEASD